MLDVEVSLRLLTSGSTGQLMFRSINPHCLPLETRANLFAD